MIGKEMLTSQLELNNGPYIGCGAISISFGFLTFLGGSVAVLMALGYMPPPPLVSVGSIEFTVEESAPVVILLGVGLLATGIGAIVFGLYCITYKCKMVFDDAKQVVRFSRRHLLGRVEKSFDYDDIVGVKFVPSAAEDDVDAIDRILSVAFLGRDEVEIEIREDRDKIASIVERISRLQHAESIENEWSPSRTP
jgi:hypothetical protein